MGSKVVAALVAASLLWAAEPEQAISPRERIHQMSEDEKQQLQRQRERFNTLDKAEQNRLRKLHKDLEQNPQSELLRQVMHRYHAWLRSLPAGQRVELMTLSSEERLAEIRRLLDEERQSRFRGFVQRPLSKQDQTAIVSWLVELARDREPNLHQSLPPEMRGRVGRRPEAERRRWWMMAVRRRFGADRRLMEALQPTDDELAELAEKLTPEARERLTSLRGSKEQARMLRMWAAAAMVSQFQPDVRPEDLRAFYEQLEPSAKESLENMPFMRRRNELQRMYLQNEFQKPRARSRPGVRPPGSRPPASRPPGARRPPGRYRGDGNP